MRVVLLLTSVSADYIMLHPYTVTVETDIQNYEVASLNFSRLLHRYYRSFAKADPVHALQYIALMTLGIPEVVSNSIKNEQKAIISDFVAELLVFSQAYSALLGELDTEGRNTVSDG